MPIFRKGAGPHAMALAMSGIRMGERLLWFGDAEMPMFAAIAAKVGLSGRAAAVVEDQAGGDRVEQAAARAGFLAEVEKTSGSVPFEAAAFDVAIIAGPWGLADSLAAGPRAHWLAESYRLLRGGGRLLVIQRFGRPQFFGLVPATDRADVTGDRAEEALRAAGFRPVRTLARREGLLFVEGLRPNV